MLRNIWRTDVLKIISLLCWCLALFCYFFQVPFRELAKFIAPSFLLFFIFHFLKLKIKVAKLYLLILFLYFLCLGIEVFQSGLRNTEISSVIRFLEILCMIPLCCFIREKEFNRYFFITVFFAVLKSLMLIGIGLYLIRIGSHSVMRNWIFSISGGDIYLSHGIPKVQLQGNGILPIIFILYCSKYKRIDFVSFILFLGVFFAGNFAFYLAIFCFIGLVIFETIKKDKKSYKISLIFFLLLLVSPFLLRYVEKKIEEKSVYSNAIRIEQAEVLLDTNWFVGKGLGNKVVGGGHYRSYNGDNYFELQTLYIFNQIGFVGLFLFYIVTIFGIYNVKFQRKRILLYFIYLFYTFWNPYCFDTTQMMTLVLLINTDLEKNSSQMKQSLKIQRKLCLNYFLK